AVGMDQPILRAPAQAGHPRPDQRLRQAFGKGKAHVRPVDRDMLDSRAVEMARQAAHGGLDFGKLGHGGALAGADGTVMSGERAKILAGVGGTLLVSDALEARTLPGTGTSPRSPRCPPILDRPVPS